MEGVLEKLMKLKLKDTLRCDAKVYGVFKEDTPMTVFVTGPWTETTRSNQPGWHQSFYWTLDDAAFNLVEVNVDIETGALTGLDIPLYNGNLRDLSESTHTLVDEAREGIPCFDMAPWAPWIQASTVTKCFTFPGRCQFELALGILRVVLVPDAVRYQVTVNESFACEFNEDDEFCAFVLRNLEYSQVAAIEAYVNRRRRK